jgi:hypothetical protein
MKSSVLGWLVVVAITVRPASAQTATTEVDLTVGHSTEDVQAASSQLRLFGDAVAGWQYYVEASWAQQWGNRSDAFGSGYPYDKRLRPAEMYAERTLLKGRYLAGVRMGQFRTPFGLSSRSDQAYTGFLRAPLIRYGGYWALSNNFLEDGVSIAAGTPRLFAEASAGRPHDQDAYARRPGLDSALRIQGAIGPVILGVSHIHTQPAQRFKFALGAAVFTGVDVRWMRDGVQLRGEWIDGHALGGTRTFGGYLDAFVHRPIMGPVTAVLRAERLDYPAGRFSSFPRRYTTGARVRVSSMLVGQLNIVHQPADVRLSRISAVDLAFTISARR